MCSVCVVYVLTFFFPSFPSATSFARIVEETTSTVEHVQHDQHQVVLEYDRLLAAGDKEEKHLKLANLHLQKILAKHNHTTHTNNHTTHTNNHTTTNHHHPTTPAATLVRVVCGGLKKSSSLAQQLFFHANDDGVWVRREILIDTHYVGWFQPLPSMSPTGGVQLRHIGKAT
jgi:hypothetical protein